MMMYRNPFVLASTKHGSMIVNVLDWKPLSGGIAEWGPGRNLLADGVYDPDQLAMTHSLLQQRRNEYGDGVVALDCGANIGVYTVEMAKAMDGWGNVVAWEPQERVYYALAGNIAINNVFNAKATNAAVGGECCVLDMQVPDHRQPANFGGLSLRVKNKIGQDMNTHVPVTVVSIDSMNFDRVDFIKLDVEGMEAEVLRGARETIIKNSPYMMVEFHVTGREPIQKFMDDVGYDGCWMGMDVLCAPKGNAALAHINSLWESFINRQNGHS